ncbi:hypothetical protein X798_01347, partial [Onchocerca flexuosa]
PRRIKPQKLLPWSLQYRCTKLLSQFHTEPDGDRRRVAKKSIACLTDFVHVPEDMVVDDMMLKCLSV